MKEVTFSATTKDDIGRRKKKEFHLSGQKIERHTHTYRRMAKVAK